MTDTELLRLAVDTITAQEALLDVYRSSPRSLSALFAAYRAAGRPSEETLCAAAKAGLALVLLRGRLGEGAP